MFYSRKFLTACLLACLARPAYADHASLSFGAEAAGPVTTIPAATLPQGRLALSLTGEFIRAQRFSDAELAALAGRHVHAHSVDWLLTTSLGVSYGMSDDLTLSLRVPHVHRENVRSGSHSHGGGAVTNTVEDHGDSHGYGDIAALGKYRFWNHGGQAALLFGIKAPTGRTDVMDGGQKLEAEHQPGSGSWDGLSGLAIGGRAGPVSLDASALYALVTEGAQDTNLGDRLQYNLAASYRLPRRDAWDLILELNGEWADQQRVEGETDEDSGGNQIFISPGLRYAPGEKWSAHLSVGIPAVSNIGEGHADTDYKVTIGLARAF